MSLIPHVIPDSMSATTGGVEDTYVTLEATSLYDVGLGGVGFMCVQDEQNPAVRETAQFEKNRIDSGTTPGEQTLSNWWLKSQDSFHGGAGQINLEPSIQNEVAHLRYDMSKNVDPFTPGQLRRLPDMKLVSSDSVTQLVGVTVSGADALAVLRSTGDVRLLTNLDGVVTDTPFVGATSGVFAIATDGTKVYAANATGVLGLDPAAPSAAAATIATWPATPTVTRAALGWTKARLMAAANNTLYEVDVSVTGTALGSGQLRLTHPQANFRWRCFSDAPAALIACGDANGVSEIAQFTINQVAGAPVLQVSNITAPIPVGEQILSMTNAMGSFQAIGTTRGVRIGSFDSFYGRLTFGPLTLTPVDPVIPGNQVFCRDRFVYVAGKAYDEPGLLAVDLGTPTDQAGRYAWAPSLIPSTPNLTGSATSGCVTPVGSRVAFAVPGSGVYFEGTTAGSVREAWLRTSRIRYGTTEPKLFKVGSLRGDLSNGTVKVVAETLDSTTPLGTLGFTSRPPDFRLPAGRHEWMQLTFNLFGSDVLLRSYAVKALPGTIRQLRIKLVLSLFDNEQLRSGQDHKERFGARRRRDMLEQFSASGDVVLLQEFTPSNQVVTPVVVEQVSFTQGARPTAVSDVGGVATVILRTVDA